MGEVNRLLAVGEVAEMSVAAQGVATVGDERILASPCFDVVIAEQPSPDADDRWDKLITLLLEELSQ